MRIEALYDWAAGNAGGIPVIWEEQDGPRPVRDFVTIKTSPFTRLGFASIGAPDRPSPITQAIDVNGDPLDVNGEPLQVQEDADGWALIQQDQEFTLSVQAYSASDAITPIEALRSSLSKPSVQMALKREGLAFVRELTGVQDITAIVATGFESRAVIDILFRRRVTTVDELGVIESVEITGEYGDNEYTQTVEVEHGT